MSEQENLPRVWLARAGRHGEDEQTALDKGLVIIGFYEIGDLAPSSTYKEIFNEWQLRNPEASPASVGHQAGQLNAFRNGIGEGDIVVLPLLASSGIALGRAKGPYKYQEIDGAMRHTRSVE